MIQSDTSVAKRYAYSYVRFSSPEQMSGDSIRRQTALAVSYADEFSLILDDRLTYRDYGISGFRGQNSASGRLGDFLGAVSLGIVPQGSLLLVENLDRLSRESALNAQSLLTQIVLAGITIVTLSDRRTYSIDELRRDPMGLIYALINFIRANEESELKSFRGKASFSAKRAIAESEPITSSCPRWLSLNKNDKTFSIIPARAKVVRDIFSLAQKGVSNTKIAETFNRHKVPAWKSDSLWTRDKVGWIARSSAVIGTFIPHVIEWKDGRQTRVPCPPIRRYYPAIISVDTFQQVQTGRLTSNWAGHGSIGYILNQIAVCENCGSLMIISPSAPNGPSMICSASVAGTAAHYAPIAYGPVDAALRQGLSAIFTACDISAPGYGRSRRLSVAQNNVDRARRELLAVSLSSSHTDLLEEMRHTLYLLEQDLLDKADMYQHSATSKLEKKLSEAIGCLSTGRHDKKSSIAINKVIRIIFSKVVVRSETGHIDLYHDDGKAQRINI
ncbi:recombinase family protein [Sphingomonas sp. Leaf226]|uniref:recombinase family protein n=1 Tax=Sphingomonas sp. Leaf226 TaxID=1735691 RepID=UPI000B08D8BE|nr:recombinase family protein [Sphingomonas sp. Leaf226]